MLVEGKRLRKVNKLVTDLNSEKQPEVSRCKLIACIISGRLEEQVELLF